MLCFIYHLSHLVSIFNCTIPGHSVFSFHSTSDYASIHGQLVKSIVTTRSKLFKVLYK